MEVQTKTKQYNVMIMGVSPYDDVLRIEIVRPDLNDVFGTFTNPQETKTITHIMDGQKTILRGYTKFLSIDCLKNGNVIVALDRK